MGVDNLAKPLKENIIEGLLVLVSKIAVIMMKNDINLSIIKVNDIPRNKRNMNSRTNP